MTTFVKELLPGGHELVLPVELTPLLHIQSMHKTSEKYLMSISTLSGSELSLLFLSVQQSGCYINGLDVENSDSEFKIKHMLVIC
ncbi:TPA: hypothetical protein ACTYBL_002327 [Klebsiella aerogenes]